MNEYLIHTPETKNGYRVSVGAFKDGASLNVGVSICTPGDNFSKRTARMKALGRAKSKKASHMTIVSDNPADVVKGLIKYADFIKARIEKNERPFVNDNMS